MNVYLDCEFNGFGGQLLSIAIVPEEGHHFYAEVIPTETLDPWVAQNVMPLMDGEPRVSPETLTRMLRTWLGRQRKLHIIVDWPDDITYFCKALMTGPGQMIPTPPLTFELRRDLSCDLAGDRRHNALADAYALKTDHFLKRVIREGTVSV